MSEFGRGDPLTHAQGTLSVVQDFTLTDIEVDAHENAGPSISPPPPTPPLLRLPPEIIDDLLAHVPPQLLQRTSMALAHVIPDYPIASRHLWTHLVVGRAQQLTPLWRKLKDEGAKPRGGGTRLVKTFAQESWKGDADILNNVLRCLPTIRTLMLNIGTNFAPEHLQEMFEDPRPGIERMEMRFRPYVEQATYYQFLKGSYFDTAIETLYRRWPEVPSFTHLSIVQDLPPRTSSPPKTALTASSSLINGLGDLQMDDGSAETDSLSLITTPTAPATPAISSAPSSADVAELKGYTGHGPIPYLSEGLSYAKPKHFAQPIVFFDIKCLARFGVSPVAHHLTHLRLRIPSRDLAYVLVSPPTTTGGLTQPMFPSLRYLDLSTTNVRLDAVLATLLRSYARLEHLVLDRVNLFGFTARERGPDLCHELAGMCVSAGLARGKERERQIAAWDLTERTRLAQLEQERQRLQTSGNNAPGEDDSDEDEGLRAARESERQEEAMREEMQRQILLARSRRGHRSAAHSTFSLRDRPRGARGAVTATAGSSQGTSVTPLPQNRLYFVLPPLPTLRTMSIGGEAPLLSSFRLSTWEDEFHAGWREGLAKVHGWAVHIADKYERAQRKAEEWHEWQARAAPATTSIPTSSSSSKSKAKAKVAPSKSTTSTSISSTAKPKPPLDIRLFRFPLASEPAPASDPSDPTVGLIEIHPTHPRSYMDEYKSAIADAELYTHSQAVAPPCVFCTVPDCEGPARRGAEGERVDGRGGMGGVHKPDCGHVAGRGTWGWAGV